jgi:hypothetical protein
MVDVLTQVWEGVSTIAAIAERVAAKQDRDSVLANVGLLERRGDLRRFDDSVTISNQGRTTRDGIEARSDAAYFGGWPGGVRLRALADDFDALRRAVDLEPTAA